MLRLVSQVAVLSLDAPRSCRKFTAREVPVPKEFAYEIGVYASKVKQSTPNNKQGEHNPHYDLPAKY
jgi:hypothetical protein